MDREINNVGCSLDNEYIQILLDNLGDRGYWGVTLRDLINGYYNIYCDFYECFDVFIRDLSSKCGDDTNIIFKNAKLDNVSTDDNLIYNFELVSDFPISFRLPFTFDSNAERCEKLKYIGDKKDNLVHKMRCGSFSNDELEYLELALENYIRINKNSIFTLSGSLPYVICFDHNRITINNANDTSNNMNPLVDIDIEEITISFNDSIADNEFTAIFAEYLALVLENAYVMKSDVNNTFGYIKTLKGDFVYSLLTKYNMMEKKIDNITKEEYPKGKIAYYLNLPNEGYELITGYMDVKYNEKTNCYDFRFYDYTKLSIPVSSVLVIDADTKLVRNSEAYDIYKKLTLKTIKKD